MLKNICKDILCTSHSGLARNLAKSVFFTLCNWWVLKTPTRSNFCKNHKKSANYQRFSDRIRTCIGKNLSENLDFHFWSDPFIKPPVFVFLQLSHCKLTCLCKIVWKIQICSQKWQKLSFKAKKAIICEAILPKIRQMLQRAKWTSALQDTTLGLSSSYFSSNFDADQVILNSRK